MSSSITEQKSTSFFFHEVRERVPVVQMAEAEASPLPQKLEGNFLSSDQKFSSPM